MDLSIYKQGRDAAKRGLHPADNPFKAVEESAYARWWHAGWCDGITGQDHELNNRDRS